MALNVKPVQLNPKTLEAFDAYIHNTETGREQSLHRSGSFLCRSRRQSELRSLIRARWWHNFGLAKDRSKCRRV